MTGLLTSRKSTSEINTTQSGHEEHPTVRITSWLTCVTVQINCTCCPITDYRVGFTFIHQYDKLVQRQKMVECKTLHTDPSIKYHPNTLFAGASFSFSKAVSVPFLAWLNTDGAAPPACSVNEAKKLLYIIYIEKQLHKVNILSQLQALWLLSLCRSSTGHQHLYRDCTTAENV